MSEFVIIPDTSCDLNRELRERFGIPDYLRGILYYPDGREKLSSLDWEETSPKEYYDSMKGRKALYTTATPPMGDVMATFEKHLKEGKDVLSIALSGALSASHSTYEKVAEELRKKYPDRKIICVDSLRYSVAAGLLCIDAYNQKEAGKTIEETADYLNRAKYTIHQTGSMDDLFFLVKTKRVSGAKAFFGTMIGLNIMADFNHQGMAEVLGKIKGQKAAIETTLRYMESHIENPEEQIIFVAHTNREAAANLLAARIKEKFNPREVIITSVGTACGATIGPGLCAAYYHGKPISEDSAEERASMEAVIEAINAKK